MKYKIGQIVREGGELGPISQIVDYKNGIYKLVSKNSTGYLEEENIKPFKEKYEQLNLFEL